MKKIYSVFLLFCLYTCIKAQLIIPAERTTDRIFFEEIIRQAESYNGSETVEEYLSPLKQSRRKNAGILYCGLRAKLITAQEDALSPATVKYFEHCIEEAAATGDKALQLWSRVNYIDHLYRYRHYRDISSPLLESMKLIHEVPKKKLIQKKQTYMLIGWILSTLGDDSEARNYLMLYQQQLSPESREYADALDYIGQTYLGSGDVKQAKKYFLQSIQSAKSSGNIMRRAKAMGNLGAVYFAGKDYATAIDLLKTDIKLSEQQADYMNFMFANIRLSEIYLENGQLNEAQKALDAAKQVAVSKSYYRSSEQQILSLQLKIFEQNPHSDAELEIRRRLEVLEDSLKYSDGEASTNALNWDLQKGRYSEQLSDASGKAKREELLKNILLVVAAFLCLLAVYQYLSAQKKMKAYNSKVAYYENEKLKFEKLFDSRNADYQGQIAYIRNKNEQIREISEELVLIENNPISRLEKKTGKLRAILQSHLMTDENWNNFKKAFIAENPEILPMLNSRFPEITESNLRIIFLQKLGYNNTETAELLGITTDAVKKSKQRLRKKLGERHTELELLLTG